MTVLNPEQEEAVRHTGSPLLIIAGAGSGKTRVLTEKIAYLIRENIVAAQGILAITFTNKAAKEMKERTHALLGETSMTGSPFIGTFHSFCLSVLRESFDHLGRSRQFVIYDSADQKQLVKQAMKDLQISEGPSTQVGTILQAISGFKQALMPADVAMEMAEVGSRSEDIAKIYRRYQSLLLQNEAVDFDDMISETVRLFQTVPDVLAQYQGRYQYVLIDEYQDTNSSQHLLASLLAKAHNQLCVVGDFDQTIYSWRGAKVDNILRFEQEFPGTKVIRLEQNYRSSSRILNAANALISNNSQRLEKRLWTENEDGVKLDYVVAFDEAEEANCIINGIIQARHDHELNFSDFAVLYRTNAQSRVIEEAFNRQKIPYKLVGGLRFFSRQEVKDILAYLQLVQSPNDFLSFSRVIQRPSRGVGQRSLEKIQLQLSGPETLAGLALDRKLDVSAKQGEAIYQVFSLVSQCQALIENKASLASVMDLIMKDSGYSEMLLAQGEEGKARLDTVDELKSLLGSESSLSEFLERLALMTDHEKDSVEEDTVTLMTLHHAKGLEFPFVFIAGCEEGLLPYTRFGANSQQIEEERRLAYVGITRGMKAVQLLGCQQRMLFGDIWHHDISRFIREIPHELLQCRVSERVWRSDTGFLDKLRQHGIAYLRESRDAKPVLSVGKAESIDVVPGDVVNHKVWGHGTLLAVEGEGEKCMYRIAFGGDVRTLMAKYSPLEKV